jgi:hypothetical protein
MAFPRCYFSAAAVAAVPPDPSGGIELPQFCRKPLGPATNRPQPRFDFRTMSGDPPPRIRLPRRFYLPPGSVLQQTHKFASHAVDFAQHAVRPKLKSEAAAGNDDGGT